MDGDRLPVHTSPHQPSATSYFNNDTAYHVLVPPVHAVDPYPDSSSKYAPPSLLNLTLSPATNNKTYHLYSPQSDATRLPAKVEPPQPNSLPKPSRKLSRKWKRRLYWIVPLAVISVALLVLFEIYRSDFERWLQPLANWLRKRDAWSWIIPTTILLILSFPPLFGHEIVMLLVGLTYPIGVGIGIASAGAVLGEAACFVVFKYFFTWWVDKKIEQKVNWAATARVSQEAGFRGVLIIRYSIVPPHLANPLFACTGMSFWLYMITVLLSLPKTIIFVILGAPSSQNSSASKWGKVVAIGVLVIITIFASLWIRKKSTVAIRNIKAERAGAEGDEMHEMLDSPGQPGMDGMGSPPTTHGSSSFSPPADGRNLPHPSFTEKSRCDDSGTDMGTLSDRMMRLGSHGVGDSSQPHTEYGIASSESRPGYDATSLHR